MLLALFKIVVFIFEFCTLLSQSTKAIYQHLKDSIFGKLPKSVRGRVIVITGAGSGIGRELAFKFAELGAKIVVLDIDKENGLETTEKINECFGESIFLQVDVTDPKSVDFARQEIEQRYGAVFMLINNAGILNARPLVNLTTEMIVNTIKTNLTSQLFTVRAFLPSMIKNKSGHIVAISSNCGIYGKCYFTDYSASKAGIIGFMTAIEEEIRLLRIECRDSIFFTTLCPAAINTGLSKAIETRFPTLFPILEIDRATNLMIEAILTDKKFAIIPKSYSILYKILRNCPSKVEQLILDFIGNTAEADGPFNGPLQIQ